MNQDSRIFNTEIYDTAVIGVGFALLCNCVDEQKRAFVTDIMEFLRSDPEMNLALKGSYSDLAERHIKYYRHLTHKPEETNEFLDMTCGVSEMLQNHMAELGIQQDLLERAQAAIIFIKRTFDFLQLDEPIQARMALNIANKEREGFSQISRGFRLWLLEHGK
ncbi:hypothetical protein GC177_06505, partial [bacterium]|nr:hypothetical protein [bacterium]